MATARVIGLDGRYEEEVSHNYLAYADGGGTVPKAKLVIELDPEITQAILAALDESYRQGEHSSQGVDVTILLDTSRYFWKTNGFHESYYSENISAVAYKMEVNNYGLQQRDVRETAPDEWVMWTKMSYTQYSRDWKALHTASCRTCAKQTGGKDIEGHICSDCILAEVREEIATQA